MVKSVVPPWDNPTVNLHTMKDTRHTHTHTHFKRRFTSEAEIFFKGKVKRQKYVQSKRKLFYISYKNKEKVLPAISVFQK